ncbi:MAG: hypothetical protein ACUZ8N_04830 [Candidatus Scalindua sp.]
MTSKKRYKKQISSLKEVIKDHIEKIEQENLKDSPNIDRIRHWEKEIKNGKRVKSADGLTDR